MPLRSIHYVLVAAACVLLGGCSSAFGTVGGICDDNYCEAGADSVSQGPDGGFDASTNDAHDADAALHDAPTQPDGDGAAGCQAPTTLECNGTCVDPTLPAHCGTCNNACEGPDSGTGQATCTAGTCGVGCSGSTSLNCAGACVDPSEPSHCGSCTHECPGPGAGTGTAICTLGDGGGTCSVTCSGGTTESCAGSCYAPTDPNHCGSCGNACPAPPSGNGQATCTSPPTCGVTCATGYHVCGADCLSNADGPSDMSDPCVLTEAFGVFVAPTGSDTTGTGTRAAPYATIGHAMDQAKTGTLTRVYACGTAGDYSENLLVVASRAGLTVYGGLDCTTTPGTWSYKATDQATIAPASGYAASITAAVTFEDMAFVAPPGIASSSAASSSSIAVFVGNATGVLLERCTAQAGAGTAGQDQAQPTPYSSDAPNGNPGTASVAAGGTGAGGAAMPNPSCATSIGGAGGSAKIGEAPSLLDGQSGQPGPDNAGTSTACDTLVEGGSVGVGGAAGSAGLGAATRATFSITGWTPTPGQSGGTAAVGQGGGGGGVDVTGNGIGGGGGGGAGGCGGSGGPPGTGGGSSIAILVYTSAVILETCTLSAANAGRGGNGAAGQTGQPGGSGGSGNGAASCGGGSGGLGGQGGPGGGGAGGVSAGVVWTGTAPTVTAGNQTFGTAGTAGKNGDGTTTATDGTAGGVVQFQ